MQKKSSKTLQTKLRHSACVAFFLLLALTALSTPSGADEVEDFISAKHAFDAGDYEAAVMRFSALLNQGVKSLPLAVECHKMIGIAYLFVGDKEKAEQHFTEVLTLSPAYTVDPLLYPIEVLDFFTAVVKKNKERVDALTKARAEEEAKQRIAEEARRKAELLKLTRNVYLAQDKEKHSLLVAMIPFGAGQFQNGHTVKGTLFLSAEVLLSAASITTFLLHEQLDKESKKPFDDPDARRKTERLELGYRVANQASFGALVGVAILGVIDALRNYEPQTVKWRHVEEQEVPAALKPKAEARAVITPQLGARGAFLGIAATF